MRRRHATAPNGFTSFPCSAGQCFTCHKHSAEHGFTRPKRSAEHGFTRPKRSAEHGFTLIEVIVALFVFGLIAAAGVGVLSFSVRAQAISAARLDEIASIERTKAALAADLAQAVDRPIRDEGGNMLPAFTGESDGRADPMLVLVRGGWANPDGLVRASLQRVEYRVEGDQLVRLIYPMLDGAAPLPPTPLLDGISRVAWRYRHDGAWSDRWESRLEAPLPQAVELQIARADGRSFRLVFLTGTGYAPPLEEGGRRGFP